MVENTDKSLIVPPGPAPLMLEFDTSILAGTLNPDSRRTYEKHFIAYLAFAGTRETALTPATLARYALYLTTLKLSPNTINLRLAAVRSIMRTAAEQGYITQDLAEDFRHIRGVRVAALKSNLRKTTRTIITPEQMSMLTRAPGITTLLGKRDTAILHIAAASGLRAEEIVTLRPEQIEKTGKGYFLSIMGKNEIQYTHAPLSEVAYNAIQEWMIARKTAGIESPFIFTSWSRPGRPENTPLSYDGLYKLVKKYVKRCELAGISPHTFRRFMGTLLERKYGVKEAQRGLRHKNPQTTLLHYVLGDLEEGLTDGLYEP